MALYLIIEYKPFFFIVYNHNLWKRKMSTKNSNFTITVLNNKIIFIKKFGTERENEKHSVCNFDFQLPTSN